MMLVEKLSTSPPCVGVSSWFPPPTTHRRCTAVVRQVVVLPALRSRTACVELARGAAMSSAQKQRTGRHIDRQCGRLTPLQPLPRSRLRYRYLIDQWSPAQGADCGRPDGWRHRWAMAERAGLDTGKTWFQLCNGCGFLNSVHYCHSCRGARNARPGDGASGGST